MDTLLQQFAFVREQSVEALKGITEEEANRIPDGFRNSIRWHAGHLYFVSERLAMEKTGQPTQRIEEFSEWFRHGTEPATWKSNPPELIELIRLLNTQPERIRSALSHMSYDDAATPLTTSSGLRLETVGSLVSHMLYHEGLHFQTIKTYKQLLGI